MEISQEQANQLLISLKDLVTRISYDADAKNWWPQEMEQARKIIEDLETPDAFDFSNDDEDPWFGDDMMGASG